MLLSILCLFLVSGMGCSDDDEGNSADTLTDDDTAHGGFLVWSPGNIGGITVWDLSKNEATFHLGEDDATHNMAGKPVISRDAKILAYSEATPIPIGFIRKVKVRDMATGVETNYPEDNPLDSGEFIRVTDEPSISSDGSRIAVVETHYWIDETSSGPAPSEQSLKSIQVWERNTNELINVTSGDDADLFPIISADGTRVLFISNRDTPDHDFYLADVEENATLKRVSYKNGDAARSIAHLSDVGHLSASADLKWLLFLSRVPNPDDPNAPLLDYLLMNTETGAVTPLHILPPDAHVSSRIQFTLSGAAISADGTTFAVQFLWSDLDASPPIVNGPRIVVGSTESPEDMRIILSDNDVMGNYSSVALSADGRKIAYMLGPDELWISNAEGSNPAKIIGADDAIGVGGFDGLSMPIWFSN